MSLTQGYIWLIAENLLPFALLLLLLLLLLACIGPLFGGGEGEGGIGKGKKVLSPVRERRRRRRREDANYHSAHDVCVCGRDGKRVLGDGEV